MALSLTSASPAAIDVTGGFKLTLTGTFTLGVAHEVRVGPNGDNTDSLCYSGIVGQGTVCYPLSVSQLVCFTPRLPNVASALAVRVSAASGDPPALLPGSLPAVAGFYFSQTYAYRSLLPPEYATGPRSIENERDLFSLSGGTSV